MPCTISQPAIKLSICITTFNRAAFIGATLESILIQLTSDCEIVVLDGASSDDTQRVVSEYMRRSDRLRYVRQDVNNGFDRDCDAVVELANGEYCWLMTDDDLLKPGAVAAVLEALQRDFSLVVVNVEAMDFEMSRVVQNRWLSLESDRVYGPAEMDRLFAEVGHLLKYVGCVVIKRAIWLARERQRYYGSWFIFFGVIFQERLPGETLVIADPCISYRMSNSHTFSPHMREIQLCNWPSLVRSMALSESARKGLYSAEPWRSFEGLLMYRAMGSYSLTEYQRWVRPHLRSIREMLIPIFVALLPGILANAILVFYCSLTSRRYLGLWQPTWMLQLLKESHFYFRNWRIFKAGG